MEANEIVEKLTTYSTELASNQIDKVMDLCRNSATLIEQLTKELDAAKADFEIIKGCGVYGKNHYGCQACKNLIKNGGKCRHMSCGGFEWRGPTNE